MTKISDLRPFIRSLLGDVNQLGMWQYPDDQLDSAVRTVFATGNGPTAYSLSTATGTVGQLAAATDVAPALDGSALALVLYAAAMTIAVGITGASDIRTRTITVKEGAERKLALLMSFREHLVRLDEEGDGDGSPIATSQSLVHWIIANNGGRDAYALASTAIYTGGNAYSF
jgi:hypothetical protein